MKRKSIVLVLCMMLMMVFVGCGKEVAEENSTPPTSEVVSEVVSEEVSEPVSEEVSEIVSEEPSEEVATDGKIEIVNYSSYEEMLPCFEELDSVVMAVFSFRHSNNRQALLYNGASYIVEENFIMTIKSPNTISNITTTTEYVNIVDYEFEGIHEWDIGVETTGTNIEVPLTIMYEDGTTEEFIVYITKDWKYAGEE